MCGGSKTVAQLVENAIAATQVRFLVEFADVQGGGGLRVSGSAGNGLVGTPPSFLPQGRVAKSAARRIECGWSRHGADFSAPACE